uniref:RNA-binding protein 19 n=1 Tax=Rhabditophanes sp. KR3021 TaxID=114890 RepID=A0AC35TXY5_9BILA
MSRIIIKGLPKNCSEDKVRNFFKKYGTLTDCKLKYSKEGLFRQFAFVGFENNQDCQKATQELNGTFLGTCRVVVEDCKSFSDDNKPRAWSKYAKDSSAYKRAHPDEEGESSGKRFKPEFQKQTVDTQYADFLKLNKIDKEATVEPTSVQSKSKDIKVVKDMIEAFTGNIKDSLIFRGLPPTIKQTNFKEWLTPIKFKSLQIKRGAEETFMIVTFEKPSDIKKVMKKHEQFLGGNKIFISKFAGVPEHNKTRSEVKKENLAIKKENQKVKEDNTNKILETGRLFVRNLAYSVGEGDIRGAFGVHGEIAEAEVIIDKKTGNNKGFALVTFLFPENGAAAYAALDGTVLKGRMLHILPGDEKPVKKELEVDSQFGLSKFQKEKQANLKVNAGKSHSWNILFLGANAVAETLAKRLEVDKADVLSGEGGHTAGVKMALAETALVRETRDFLIENGVKLDAFSNPASKRSDTVIIAKNLPAAFAKDELSRMFAGHGLVKDVLMPSEHTVSAIVIMDNAVDAKAAFDSLAYSRVRSQPMYLEWAPYDVFDAKSKHAVKKVEKDVVVSVDGKTTAVKTNKRDLTSDEKKEARKSKKHRGEEVVVKEEEIKEEVDTSSDEEKTAKEAQSEEESEMEVDQKDDTPEFEENARVFVKNLNFETRDKIFGKAFSKKYNIHSAIVSRKIDPKTQQYTLSMGFGFVQFFTHADAMDCIKTCQGIMIDGHSVDLKMSQKAAETGEKTRKSVETGEQGECCKLMVRNIAFPASIKEIRDLFQSFGNIKSIRIPKKMGSGGHRGFGFVEYMTKSEAKAAFDALVHSTHFYGRRLVLEWAHEEETLDEMREKTGNKYSGNTEAVKGAKAQIAKIEKDLQGSL